MKSPVLITSSIVMLIAGIVMCWFNGTVDILRATVITIGAAFAIGGIINLIGITVVRSKKKVNSLMGLVSWISGIGGIILGAYLLFFPDTIIPYVVYLFGLLLVAGGLTLICLMAFGEKGISYPGYYYILPVLILIDGIMVVSSDFIYENSHTLVLMTGIGFILFGISALLDLTTSGYKRHKMKKAAAEAAAEPAAAVKAATPAETEPSAPATEGPKKDTGKTAEK